MQPCWASEASFKSIKNLTDPKPLNIKCIIKEYFTACCRTAKNFKSFQPLTVIWRNFQQLQRSSGYGLIKQRLGSLKVKSCREKETQRRAADQEHHQWLWSSCVWPSHTSWPLHTVTHLLCVNHGVRCAAMRRVYTDNHHITLHWRSSELNNRKRFLHGFLKIMEMQIKQ